MLYKLFYHQFHQGGSIHLSRKLISTLCAVFFILYGPVTVFAGYKATFTPKISINQEYTGNVFITNEDTKEDYITVISPGFELEISDKSKGIKLYYAPGPSFYSTNSDNDTLRHDVSFNGWIEVSRTTKIEISNSFKYTEDPLPNLEDTFSLGQTDADSEEAATPIPEIFSTEQSITDSDTTRRRSRDVYYSNVVGINLSQQIGKTDSLSVGYAYSILENDDPDAQDSTRHSSMINYTHPFSRFLDIAINGSYTKGEFSSSADDVDNYKGGFTLTKKFTKFLSGNVRYQHTVADFDGESEDYQIFDPSIGVGYTFSKNATVSLNVGYFLQDRQDSEDEKGLSLDGNIGKTWEFKRGSINISGSSGYGESYFGAENLGFNTYYQATGSGNYKFTKAMGGTLFGSFQNNDYVNLTDDRTDDLITAGFSLTYKPLTWKWINVGLTYTYRKMNSTDDDNDYQEDRIYLNITMTPEQTIRLN